MKPLFSQRSRLTRGQSKLQTDGKPATLAVGVLVGNWKKERSITLWLIVLPIVLAGVGALTLPATRRRRKNIA